MNLLLFDIGSYIQPDWVLYLERAGHHCRNVYYPLGREEACESEAFEALFEKEWAAGAYDAVLSTNFFPVIARLCAAHQVRYLSWCYDAPINLETTEGFDLPGNHIFFFDSSQCAGYQRLGLERVYHLPLAVNCERLAAAKPDPSFVCDAAMLGTLYESTLPVLMAKMGEYERGYLDAVVKAQSDLYGAWIVDELLTEDLTAKINAHYRQLSEKAIQITAKELSYSLATHITHRDRLSLLKLLSARHEVMLFSGALSETERALLPRVKIRDRLDYIREMPRLFKSCKINLNATLRCIQSGIPLRALDIMGCGGFLLSNYQPELAAYCVPGEECVLYDSLADAVEKAAYYLAHEETRQRIAEAGLARMRQDFRYEDRIRVMFETAGLE